jgi:predicted NBD/HSP70 family sugar kinase
MCQIAKCEEDGKTRQGPPGDRSRITLDNPRPRCYTFFQQVRGPLLYSASASVEIIEDVNHAGDATLLRKLNESAVLELIRRDGPITRSDVSQRLHLSLPTITRIVTDLIEEKLVLELSAADSRGGRRPALLEFNYRANLVIAVYVGHRVIGALADLNGQIVERRSGPSLTGEAGIERLIALIRELHDHAAFLGLAVRGAGVGVPSIVAYPAGIVALAPGLGWRDVRLKERLEQVFPFPILVENEVNLIALGESWRGAGQGIRNLICISLGTGIGAGLVLGGQLHRGSHSAAGEVGYLVPGTHYLGKRANGFGTLESLADRNGLAARAVTRLATGAPSALANHSDQEITAEMVLEAARAGDSLACSALSETLDYLGIAIANLACIVDPERIVLSGDLAEYAGLFVEPIRSRIEGLVPAMPEIVVSELKMDAAVLGAVAVVMRETSDALFVHPSRA